MAPIEIKKFTNQKLGAHICRKQKEIEINAEELGEKVIGTKRPKRQNNFEEKLISLVLALS